MASSTRLLRRATTSMCQLDENLGKEVKKENVIVASLLHDVCKTNIYKPTTKRKKNALGVWEDVPGWNVVYNKLPLGHGEKSVIMLLLSGLDLTDEEMMAIRWHMGAFGLNFNSYEDERSYDSAKTLSPLVTIVQAGDGAHGGGHCKPRIGAAEGVATWAVTPFSDEHFSQMNTYRARAGRNRSALVYSSGGEA